MHGTMHALLTSQVGLLILCLPLLCVLGCLRILAAEADRGRRLTRLTREVTHLREAQRRRLQELQEQRSGVEILEEPTAEAEELAAAA